MGWSKGGEKLGGCKGRGGNGGGGGGEPVATGEESKPEALNPQGSRQEVRFICLFVCLRKITLFFC